MGQNYHETIRWLMVCIAAPVFLLYTFSTISSCNQETAKIQNQVAVECIRKGGTWKPETGVSYSTCDLKK